MLYYSCHANTALSLKVSLVPTSELSGIIMAELLLAGCLTCHLLKNKLVVLNYMKKYSISIAQTVS